MKLLANKPPVSETPIGVWLWFAMLADFILTIVAIDWWLYAHGYEMLTTEMREGLRSWYGPFIFGAICFVVAAFIWHMCFGLGGRQ